MNRRLYYSLLTSCILVAALLALEYSFTPDDLPRKIAESFDWPGASIAWALTGFSFRSTVNVFVLICGTLLNVLLYAALLYLLSALVRQAKTLATRQGRRDSQS